MEALHSQCSVLHGLFLRNLSGSVTLQSWWLVAAGLCPWCRWKQLASLTQKMPLLLAMSHLQTPSLVAWCPCLGNGHTSSLLCCVWSLLMRVKSTEKELFSCAWLWVLVKNDCWTSEVPRMCKELNWVTTNLFLRQYHVKRNLRVKKILCFYVLLLLQNCEGIFWQRYMRKQWMAVILMLKASIKSFSKVELAIYENPCLFRTWWVHSQIGILVPVRLWCF